VDILVTGAKGLIGTALRSALSKKGYNVKSLTRTPTRTPHGNDPSEISWDPTRGILDPQSLDGINAVVHLAGEPIAGLRWTKEKKRRIRESRTKGTELLAEALVAQEHPPTVLLSGSAIGFYGDTQDTEVNENTPHGNGFLAEVCQEWEAATQVTQEAGIRVAHLRTGIVLSRAGGALAKQLPLFRSGMGGKFGSGKQYLSWVSIHDAVGAIIHLLEDDTQSGPYNITAPHPVTNEEFTKALGSVLHRPTFLTTPAPLLRLALGAAQANDTLLANQRVVPTRLQESNYEFQDTTIEPALERLLTIERPER